jgi:hypothetical protein
LVPLAYSFLGRESRSTGALLRLSEENGGLECEWVLWDVPAEHMFDETPPGFNLGAVISDPRAA